MSSIFSGLWVRFGKNTRHSVLGYVVILQKMIQYMEIVRTDDNKCSCLFRIIKAKENKHKIVHRGQVLIFIDLALKITERKGKQKSDTWQFKKDGPHKFKYITKNNMVFYSLLICTGSNICFIQFYWWEKALQSLHYQCFSRISRQKIKSISQSSDVYEKIGEIDNVIRSQEPNKIGEKTKNKY